MSTLEEQAHQRILELSVAHCLELFKTYGVELSPTDTHHIEGRALLYCGIIGFSGENIRGSLAIAGSGALLRASNPVEGGAPRDWAAELVNQLMGHVKSRLLGYAVEVYMSTPIVLRGERLALESRGEFRPTVFTSGAGPDEQVALWVDVEVAPEFQMAAEENTALAGTGAGQTLMF
jgi:hypothetical protein